MTAENVKQWLRNPIGTDLSPTNVVRFFMSCIRSQDNLALVANLCAEMARLFYIHMV